MGEISRVSLFGKLNKLGYQPKIKFDHGIEKTIYWFENYFDQTIELLTLS